MSENNANTANRTYAERLVFMAGPAVLAGFLQGWRAVLICVICVLSAMLADGVCSYIRKLRYNWRDAAVPFWGLACAMLLPVSAPFHIAAFSAIMCIIVGKHFFGASDNIVFSPPAISTAFMIVCYPALTLYAPKFGDIYPVFGDYDGVLLRSHEYSMQIGITPSDSVWDTILGFTCGTIGAVYGLVIIVCGICLAVRGKNSPAAMLSACAVVAVMAFFFPRIGTGGWKSVFYELTSGYFLFGVVFLAAEPYRIPKKRAARVIYGASLGFIVMMFRIFGKTEGGFLFALLIISAVESSFDRLVENFEYFRKNYITSFEKNKTTVQRGDVKLTDTQEIVIPEKYRYNTPPIDSEIKKKRANRRRPNGRK